MTLASVPGPVLVVGASHQGEVVLDLLRQLPSPPFVAAVIDSSEDGEFVGRKVGGHRVLATIADLESHAGGVVGAIPAVGDCSEREAIAAALDRHRIPMLPAVHPRAHLAGDVQIGAGSVVMAGAVIGVGARIGRACIVNSAAIVEHHGHVGDYSHVAPGAKLAGGVRVGERVWIGIGATVLEDLLIGPDAEVGAGAVVVQDVEAGSIVIGVPARPFRDRHRSHPERDLV